MNLLTVQRLLEAAIDWRRSLASFFSTRLRRLAELLCRLPCVSCCKSAFAYSDSRVMELRCFGANHWSQTHCIFHTARKLHRTRHRDVTIPDEECWGDLPAMETPTFACPSNINILALYVASDRLSVGNAIPFGAFPRIGSPGRRAQGCTQIERPG